jgi:hypothetical protein
MAMQPPGLFLLQSYCNPFMLGHLHIATNPATTTLAGILADF